MTKVLLLTEILVIRVFQPTPHGFFIRGFKGVAEVAKACHQADGDARPAIFGIKCAELLFKQWPVDQGCQPVQFMAPAQGYFPDGCGTYPTGVLQSGFLAA
jgi:hypothetical protein